MNLEYRVTYLVNILNSHGNICQNIASEGRKDCLIIDKPVKGTIYIKARLAPISQPHVSDTCVSFRFGIGCMPIKWTNTR